MELYGAKRTAFAIPRLQEKSVTAVITEIEKNRKKCKKVGKGYPCLGVYPQQTLEVMENCLQPKHFHRCVERLCQKQ